MSGHHVFRLILIVGFVAVLPVGIYHRLKAATFEKLDRRQEGLFLLISIRLLGLVQLATILTFLIDPSLLAWSSVPVPVALRWAGVGLGMVGSALFIWTLRNLGKNLTDAVVAGENGTVAAVRGMAGMIGLPGGASLPGETAEETVRREVGEELARSVRLVPKIGEATQFFYAADEDCHYKMLGVFFLAEFPDKPEGQGEHELFWLPLAEAAGAFFHECHAWAAHQGLENST